MRVDPGEALSSVQDVGLASMWAMVGPVIESRSVRRQVSGLVPGLRRWLAVVIQGRAWAKAQLPHHLRMKRQQRERVWLAEGPPKEGRGGTIAETTESD